MQALQRLIPPPSLFRGIVGFAVIGITLLFFPIGFLRWVVWGIPMKFIDLGIDFTDLSEHGIDLSFDSIGLSVLGFNEFLNGWFYDDEAMLMWFGLTGAIGFIWGIGGFASDSGHTEAKPERPKRKAIPEDPDAAVQQRSNPLAPIMSAVPALGLVTGVTLLFVIVLFVGSLIAPNTVTQIEADEANVGEIDEDARFSLLGITDAEGNQGLFFVIFVGLVLGGVISIALLLGVAVLLINNSVNKAKEEAPEPVSNDTYPIKLVRFFVDWTADMVDTAGDILDPNSQLPAKAESQQAKLDSGNPDVKRLGS